MPPKKGPGKQALSEEQIEYILANFDLESEKMLSELKNSADRQLTVAREQMEARLHKIPPDVRNITLQAYYDMHADTAGSERGRQLPPLAMASLPNGKA